MDANRQRSLLLIMLYLSFISLGLPDTILGTAWPEMRLDFGKSLENAGVLLSFTTILSAIASFSSGWFIRRFNTGIIITACACMTTAAMFGYAFSTAWGMLIFFTLFFGLGQGTVDTAVNAYMSRHYSSRHMNWVHCCWGIGATGGPFIITAVFGLGLSWRAGYRTIGAIQLVLSVIFLSTLFLWRKPLPAAAGNSSDRRADTPAEASTALLSKARQHLVSASSMAFYFLYPGVEVVIGLWGASWLIDMHGVSPARAGIAVTLYWAALTGGRFMGGVVSSRLSNANLIRLGLLVTASGACLMLFVHDYYLSLFAMTLAGAGLGPLYPTMMHDTPRRIGYPAADRLTGFQVGSNLIGTTVIPPAVGLIAQKSSLGIFLPTILIFIAAVFAAHELSFHYSLLSGRTVK